MISVFKFVILSLLTAIFYAPPSHGEAAINTVPPDLSRSASLVVDGAGHQWATFYTKDHNLLLKNPEGIETILNQTERGDRLTPTGLAQIQQGHTLYTAWRSKQLANKTLWLTATDMDSGHSNPAVKVDTLSEPLTRLKLAANKDGIYMLWLGEHDESTKGEKTKKQKIGRALQAYNLYFSRSGDHGKTFAPALKVSQGIQPAWIVDDKLIAVFSYSQLEDGSHFVMRKFNTASNKFDKEVDIKAAPPIAPFFEAFRSGDRLFLMWIGQYGAEKNQFKLEGVHSDDEGATWQDFVIDTPLRMDFSKIAIAADQNKHIVLAFSAQMRNEDMQKAGKENVYYTRSLDNGDTWSASAPLRQYSNAATKAVYPSITFLPDQTLVAVWEDWRNLSGEIYLNYSHDFGQTWQQKDLPVISSRFPATLDPLSDSLFASPGKLTLLSQGHKDFSMLNADLIATSIDLKAAAAGNKEIKPTGEDALRDRVTTYWNHYLKGEYSEAFPFNDPFYQARVGPMAYVRQRGMIKYHDYSIKAIRMDHNIAQVDVEITYSIPQMLVGTRPFSKEKTTAMNTETWIFVDGNWYRQYFSEENNLVYTQY